MSSRFYRWQRQGLWAQLLARNSATPRSERRDRLGSPYDRQHHHSGTPQCCRSKKGAGDEALGRSQGGFGTKIHLKCDGAGRPMAFRLSAGHRHEMTAFEQLLDAGEGQACGTWSPAGSCPVCARRSCLQWRESTSVLSASRHATGRPSKRDHKRPWSYDRGRDRQRNVIERLMNRLKRSRRIATRFEKRACHFEAMVTIACLMEWL